MLRSQVAVAVATARSTSERALPPPPRLHVIPVGVDNGSVAASGVPRARRAYRGATGEQRAAQRRERLVEAGIEVFGTTGYRSATVESVSTEAGLIKRYFYESFDGLESLLCVVYERIVAELRDEVMTSAVAADSASTAAIGALAGFLGWVERDPRRARIQLFEVLGVSPRIDEVYRRAAGDFATGLSDIIAAHLRPRRLGQGARDVLGSMLVGAGLQVAAQWFLDERRTPKQQLLADGGRLLTALSGPN